MGQFLFEQFFNFFGGIYLGVGVYLTRPAGLSTGVDDLEERIERKKKNGARDIKNDQQDRMSDQAGTVYCLQAQFIQVASKGWVRR